MLSSSTSRPSVAGSGPRAWRASVARRPTAAAGAQLPAVRQRGEELEHRFGWRVPRRCGTRRFSSTVSVVNSSRLSGTSTTPARLAAVACTGARGARRRPRRAAPVRGSSPASVRSRVVLPAPFGPRTAWIVPASTRDRRRGTRSSDPRPPVSPAHSSESVMSPPTLRASCRGRRRPGRDRRGSSAGRPRGSRLPKSST